MATQHILVTTDFSDSSERAVAPALQMREGSGAKITVLHVVHTYAIRPVGAPLAPPMSLPADANALAEINRALPTWAAERFGEGTECRAVVGTDIATTIAEQVKELGCDLVVISTHGRSGLQHFFLGSVTERLLRLAHVPVLCVPPAS